MAKLKKAQGGIGRLFNKAGMKMVEATTKKGLKKTTSAAMSPGQRDLAEAIRQIEIAELKKKMQAIDRRMEGEKVLNSIGKKQRSGGKIKPKASNVSKKLGSAKKSIGNMRFTKKKK
jgi:hypothetical protein